MTSPPFFYDYQNWANSQHQPSTVHVKNTGLSKFFQRYLIQKLIAVFEWTMPDTWARNYALYTLYCWGFFAVVRTDKFGVIPQQCGLRGYDVMYQPTNAVITNPLLSGILEPRIGRECTIVRLQPDYGGVWDIVSFYADQMALIAEAFGVNTVNSKMPFIFLARNSQTANSFKKMYDEFSAGNPCVVVDKALFQDPENPNFTIQPIDATPPENIKSLLEAWKQVEIMFETQVGIPNVSSSKRERELSTELAANTMNTQTIASGWLDSLQKSCESTRDMFGIEISVKWRWDEIIKTLQGEGENDEVDS